MKKRKMPEAGEEYVLCGVASILRPSQHAVRQVVYTTLVPPHEHDEGALVACFFFFQAQDGIRFPRVTGVQTCALPISVRAPAIPSATQRPLTGSTKKHAS